MVGIYKIENHRIKPERLNEYLQNGYIKGKKGGWLNNGATVKR